jgi:hypothetical protein
MMRMSAGRAVMTSTTRRRSARGGDQPAHPAGYRWCAARSSARESSTAHRAWLVAEMVEHRSPADAGARNHVLGAGGSYHARQTASAASRMACRRTQAGCLGSEHEAPDHLRVGRPVSHLLTRTRDRQSSFSLRRESLDQPLGSWCRSTALKGAELAVRTFIPRVERRGAVTTIRNHIGSTSRNSRRVVRPRSRRRWSWDGRQVLRERGCRSAHSRGHPS